MPLDRHQGDKKMTYAEDITDNGTILDTEENIMMIRDEMSSEIAMELDEIWQDIKDLAVELCPKESGALASSIELESEGGSGTVGSGATTDGGVIYENAIYAVNDSTFNFDGQPTSQYAQAVHDGHMIGSSFWEGVPFLEDALDTYSSELDAAVATAMDNLLGDIYG
jgi:hypothetical protein